MSAKPYSLKHFYSYTFPKTLKPCDVNTKYGQCGLKSTWFKIPQVHVNNADFQDTALWGLTWSLGLQRTLALSMSSTQLQDAVAEIHRTLCSTHWTGTVYAQTPKALIQVRTVYLKVAVAGSLYSQFSSTSSEEEHISKWTQYPQLLSSSLGALSIMLVHR